MFGADGLQSASKQWGYSDNITAKSYITLPVTETPIAVVANDIDTAHNPLILSTANYESGKFMLDGQRADGTLGPLWAHWIAICK